MLLGLIGHRAPLLSFGRWSGRRSASAGDGGAGGVLGIAPGETSQTIPMRLASSIRAQRVARVLRAANHAGKGPARLGATVAWASVPE